MSIILNFIKFVKSAKLYKVLIRLLYLKNHPIRVTFAHCGSRTESTPIGGEY